MFKDIVFYTVAASIIGFIAQIAGASLAVVLFSALLIPPIILLVFRIIR